MVKVTEEELAQLKESQAKVELLAQRFGQLTVQKKLITMDLDNTESYLEGAIHESKTIQQAMEQKYGVGTLNLETGEFTKE
jgi:hypothetical protein